MCCRLKSPSFPVCYRPVIRAGESFSGIHGAISRNNGGKYWKNTIGLYTSISARSRHTLIVKSAAALEDFFLRSLFYQQDSHILHANAE